VTIFFPDVSNFQAGLRIQPGTVALIAKTSEGTYYTDASYAGFKAQAAAVGSVFSAYHFLKAGNGAGQADYCHAIVGATPVMLDVEPEGTSRPSVADCAAFIARMRQLGGRVWGVYYPRWYWSQTGGDLASLDVALIASGYPGSYSDTDANWNTYGGRQPDIWQYTDRQPYGAMSVDFNAYRGTTAQLAALINGTTTPTGDNTVTPNDIWGFKNARLDPIDMRQRLVNAEIAAEQARDQANAIKTELDSVNGKLDALINTINGLRTGGIDVGVLAGDITHAIGTKLAG
jgi:hypothetical protein